MQSMKICPLVRSTRTVPQALGRLLWHTELAVLFVNICQSVPSISQFYLLLSLHCFQSFPATFCMVLECFRSNPNDHHLFLIAGEDYGDPWPSAGGSLIAATWPQKMTSRGPPRRMPCHRFLGGSPSGVVESPSCVSNFFGHRIWMPFPTDRHRIFF